MEKLFINDEGLNPTGSFKACGLCMVISRANDLERRKSSSSRRDRIDRHVEGIRRDA